MASSTTSILARIMREVGSGAVATRSGASSPDIVSHPSPPASCPAAITTTGAQTYADAVTLSGATTLTSSGKGNISLNGTVDGAFPVVESAVDRAIVALCAEATGCMDAINAATLEYIKTRKQFGVPIGKFQVLQHRMVDCFTNAQEARSMTLMASLKIDDKDPTVRAKAASGAKVQIGKSGKFCGQSAVQMHGGMGVTDELSVSHYFKRLTMIDLMFGNQQHHLTRYSNLAMAA